MRALHACERGYHQLIKAGILDRRGVAGRRLGLRTPAAAGLPAGLSTCLDPLQAVVEQELVAGRRQQVRGGITYPDTDYPTIQLTQLLHQRREVTVARAKHEGRHVVTFEGQLKGVYDHLDIGGVLPGGTHSLRYLDQLNLMAGEVATVLVETGPVGVGPSVDDASPLGHGACDRSKVEALQPEALSRAYRQVLVVEKQAHPFLVGIGSHGSSVPARAPEPRIATV